MGIFWYMLLLKTKSLYILDVRGRKSRFFFVFFLYTARENFMNEKEFSQSERKLLFLLVFPIELCNICERTKLRSEIVWHRFFAVPTFIRHFRSYITVRKLLV